ncbi:YIP1 family protein [Pseudoponticoccus marisrubri]|uniref:Yip1 domain-containing protein n=1 Tax=Pseudoponticoccus marisrubri TaxID=1685382 RepID=A0A0W7WLI2_9RHOB|nr:YIP1 family protein [Pseudoponticoccus marisrubri]KUF11461.1 hypothetical protein AVJ23_06760 [Pseudoponticoccus marisrubri]
MALTTDIAATYRGPGAVMRRLLALGRREDRALAILMGACVVMFIAQWPRLARDAHLQDLNLQMEMGGALLGTIFILPLVFYGLAGLVHLGMKLFGGLGDAYGSRLALFWALLAASPLALLYGLVAGFVGQGAQLTIVGLVWFVAFMWFWISGLRVVHRGQAA